MFPRSQRDTSHSGIKCLFFPMNMSVKTLGPLKKTVSPQIALQLVYYEKKHENTHFQRRCYGKSMRGTYFVKNFPQEDAPQQMLSNNGH